MPHTCIWEAEADRTLWVPGRPGLCSEILSEENNSPIWISQAVCICYCQSVLSTLIVFVDFVFLFLQLHRWQKFSRDSVRQEYTEKTDCSPALPHSLVIPRCRQARSLVCLLPAPIYSSRTGCVCAQSSSQCVLQVGKARCSSPGSWPVEIVKHISGPQG